jgi:hypothetical protein
MKAISLIGVEKYQERVNAVWAWATSPALAIMEEHPKDADIICRLQVIAEERS